MGSNCRVAADTGHVGFQALPKRLPAEVQRYRISSLTEVFMRTIPFPAVLLAGSMLLPACADTNSTAPLQEPSFNFMNNPDNGNVNLFRFEDGYAICWTDSRSSLRACHSTVPLGGGTEPDCGLQADQEPVAIQGVLTGENIRQILQGPVWVTVRDLDQPGDLGSPMGAAVRSEE